MIARETDEDDLVMVNNVSKAAAADPSHASNSS